MYQTTMPPDAAVGHILRHNIAAANGRKALSKGHRLTAKDSQLLRELGVEQVHVAVFEPGDVHEDEAARRLSAAVCGPNVVSATPAASRVNVLAAADGIVRVDVAALLRINAIDGLTVATLPANSLVRARKRLATIKIIPFAIPEEHLRAAEAIAQGSAPVLSLDPLRAQTVGVVLVGSPAAEHRIQSGVLPAIVARVEELGSRVGDVRYVAPEEAQVAGAVAAQRDSGAELIIVAGETSIMDRDDITPRAIRQIGGKIEQYGAPVEPGNLLLLAYLPSKRGDVPILGAPGCVRSRDVNIVDLLLPRLLAGERIAKRDVVALGHGGLL